MAAHLKTPIMRRVLPLPNSLFACLWVFLALSNISAAGVPRRLHPPPKTTYMAIVSVNKKAMTITIAPKNSTSTETKTFKMTPATKVTLNGKPGTLASLKPGLQITVGAGMDPETAEELQAVTPPRNPR